MGELTRLEKECFGEDAWPWWDLVGVLTFDRNVRLKATIDDRMVGFIAGDLKQAEHTGWIVTLGVVEAHRGMGIASSLLAACEQKMGTPRVCLCVRQTNNPAIVLYTNSGYKHSTVWKSYYTDGEDALVLEKMLNFPDNH